MQGLRIKELNQLPGPVLVTHTERRTRCASTTLPYSDVALEREFKFLWCEWQASEYSRQAGSVLLDMPTWLIDCPFDAKLFRLSVLTLLILEDMQASQRLKGFFTDSSAGCDSMQRDVAAKQSGPDCQPQTTWNTFRTDWGYSNPSWNPRAIHDGRNGKKGFELLLI